MASELHTSMRQMLESPEDFTGSSLEEIQALARKASGLAQQLLATLEELDQKWPKVAGVKAAAAISKGGISSFLKELRPFVNVIGWGKHSFTREK